MNNKKEEVYIDYDSNFPLLKMFPIDNSVEHMQKNKRNCKKLELQL